MNSVKYNSEFQTKYLVVQLYDAIYQALQITSSVFLPKAKFGHLICNKLAMQRLLLTSKAELAAKSSAQMIRMKDRCIVLGKLQTAN